MTNKTRKYILLLILSVIIISMGFLYAHAGDLLLEHLAGSLNMDMVYLNNCNLAQAFLFKTSTLHGVELASKDSEIIIKSKRASVSFDYSRFFKEKGIRLKLNLYKPVIYLGKHAEEISDIKILNYLPEGFFSLQDSSIKVIDHMLCDIFLYGETAKFNEFNVYSDDVIILSNGLITDTGKTDFNVHFFVSGRVIGKLPGEVAAFLDQDPDKWEKFTVKITDIEGVKYYSMESGNFRIQIGNKDRFKDK